MNGVVAPLAAHHAGGVQAKQAVEFGAREMKVGWSTLEVLEANNRGHGSLKQEHCHAWEYLFRRAARDQAPRSRESPGFPQDLR